MGINSILPGVQRMFADPRIRWAHDPQLWVEVFVTINLAILAGDIYIAHSVNHFQKAAEYIPLYFSLCAPVVLGSVIALRWIWGMRAPWRDVGYLVGWISILVGLGGVGFWFHLQANLVEPGASLWDRLVNGAPPMAPLLFPNLVGLAFIGIWPVLPHVPEPGSGSSWLGAAYAWSQAERQWFAAD